MLSKKNVWVSSGFSNLAGLINSAKSHELSGVHAINVSKMAEFEQKRLNGTCDVMDYPIDVSTLVEFEQKRLNGTWDVMDVSNKNCHSVSLPMYHPVYARKHAERKLVWMLYTVSDLPLDRLDTYLGPRPERPHMYTG
ncbi:hypothetical protein J6590_081973 [Homalodisca vitripennis]|nr:hypothetical protein J6590_081973 [Homalodisca vitripennis]